MDVQVVEDEDNLLCIRVVDIDQVLDAVRPVRSSAIVGSLNMPFSLERLIPEEEIGCAAPFVLVVLAGRNTGTCWLRLTDISAKLDRALVEADLGETGIIRPGVDVEDVLHVPDELGVLLGRDTPLLLQVRRQLVFLSVRRTNS